MPMHALLGLGYDSACGSFHPTDFESSVSPLVSLHPVTPHAGSGSIGRISVGPMKEAALHINGGSSVHVGGCSGTEIVVSTGVAEDAYGAHFLDSCAALLTNGTGHMVA